MSKRKTPMQPVPRVCANCRYWRGDPPITLKNADLVNAGQCTALPRATLLTAHTEYRRFGFLWRKQYGYQAITKHGRYRPYTHHDDDCALHKFSDAALMSYESHIS